MDSIDQEISSTQMEQQAWSESRKVEISTLAEIIVTPMVSKAPNDQKIFHQQRNKSVLDVKAFRRCLNGVLRYRSSLTMDGTPEGISAAMDHVLVGSYPAGLFFHPLSASIKFDGVKKLPESLWQKLSIENRLRSNPMVREKLV